jgi:hypothetical protein
MGDLANPNFLFLSEVEYILDVGKADAGSF